MKTKVHKINDNDFIELTNSQGMAITLCDLGASIYSIKIDSDYMTLTPLNEQEFVSSLSYFGKTVGRVAGRIANGEITISGTKYILQQNEGVNTLHGGASNFSFAKWKYTIRNLKDYSIVSFSLVSPDGEAGFPGRVGVVVKYIIYEAVNDLKIEFAAKTNKTTLLNLTNHTYFNLGETGDILDHTLLIRASNYGVMDEGLIVKGYSPLNDALDFREERRIGDHIHDDIIRNTRAFGYDHNLIFDIAATDIPKVVLKSKKYEMDIYSDNPNVVIYTDNYPSKIALKNGTLEYEHSAIAIEPQLIPGRYDQMLLTSKKAYSKFIKYEFKRRNNI